MFPGPQTVSTIDGTISFWLKGHYGRLATLGAADFGECASVFTIALSSDKYPAVRAAFRLVDQSLLSEKLLFPCRKDEATRTATAVEQFIDSHNTSLGSQIATPHC